MRGVTRVPLRDDLVLATDRQDAPPRPLPEWVIPSLAGIAVFVLVLGMWTILRPLRNWVLDRLLGRSPASLPESFVDSSLSRKSQPVFDTSKLRVIPHPPGASTDVCAVCLDPLAVRRVTMGTCNHVLHRSCLASWLVHDPGSSCPICRCPFALLDPPVGYVPTSPSAKSEMSSTAGRSTPRVRRRLGGAGGALSEHPTPPPALIRSFNSLSRPSVATAVAPSVRLSFESQIAAVFDEQTEEMAQSAAVTEVHLAPVQVPTQTSQDEGALLTE